MCQETNHTQKKQNERLVSLIEKESKLDVRIAKRLLRNNHLRLQGVREYIVIKNVMQRTGEIIGNPKNSLAGGAVSLPMNHTGIGLKRILREWHILKQEDTQERKTLKAHTLWRNGKILKTNLTTGVLTVKKTKNLLKTILFLWRKAVRTIYQTFSLSVEVVIVGSGNFNIYENPELLK